MQNLGSGSFVGGLSLRQAAVIAGLAYLLNPVPYVQFHALPALVADSGTQTVANIAAHPHLLAAAVLCILFGLHLVVIGVLMARSSYLPRWLGWLLVADGIAWVVNQLSAYLYPGASLGFLNAFFMVELVFMVWLLGWGWRIKDPLPA